MSLAPTLDFAALRAADPELAELLLETCDQRRALANALVMGIARLAAQRAVAHERDRVEAHLILAEASGHRGVDIALTAIRAGVALEPHLIARYRQVALEARTPMKLRLVNSKETEDAGTDHAS